MATNKRAKPGKSEKKAKPKRKDAPPQPKKKSGAKAPEKPSKIVKLEARRSRGRETAEVTKRAVPQKKSKSPSQAKTAEKTRKPPRAPMSGTTAKRGVRKAAAPPVDHSDPAPNADDQPLPAADATDDFISLDVLSDASEAPEALENDAFDASDAARPYPLTDPSELGGVQLEAAASAEVSDEDAIEDTTTYLKGMIEAVLFVSDKPLDLKELARAIKVDKKRTLELLEELRREYQQRGIHIDEVAGGYSYRSSPRYSRYVRGFLAQRPVRLTRAQLETLAIIAYRQPITRPEIDDVRGVDCGPVLKGLLERELIKILGKKDEAGRPMLYGTTPQFLELFNLNSLRDLPTLKEFTELSDESRQEFETEIGESAPESFFGAQTEEGLFRADAANAHLPATPDAERGEPGATEVMGFPEAARRDSERPDALLGVEAHEVAPNSVQDEELEYADEDDSDEDDSDEDDSDEDDSDEDDELLAGSESDADWEALSGDEQAAEHAPETPEDDGSNGVAQHGTSSREYTEGGRTPRADSDPE